MLQEAATASLSQEKIYDLRVRQLEMVQAVISRVAGYGSVIKNWCLTLATAVCGFSIAQDSPGLVLLAFLPICALAALDARYLRVERRFRSSFDRMIHEDWTAPPTFDFRPAQEPHGEFVRAFVSWSIVSFYLPLALGVAIVFVVARLMVAGC